MADGRLRLGLFAAFDPNWGGGESYLLNLLDALGTIDELAVTLFCGHHASAALRAKAEAIGAAQLALDQLTPRRPRWWLRKVGEYADLPWLDGFEQAVRGRVDVTYLRPLPCFARTPNVHWIPDFQERHLPALFTPAEVRSREGEYRRFVSRSRLTILQTQAAADELGRIFPAFAERARVLSFAVAIPDEAVQGDPRALLSPYALPERFIYLPGQLWRHKNHALAIEALAQAPDVVIVSTGHLGDYRGTAHVQALEARIAELGLEGRFRLLGAVPRETLWALHRTALALLNPSRFEGWSTTVEEAKALGRPLLLSDIPTHRAQAQGREAGWFGVDDPEELARLLLTIWRDGRPGPDLAGEALALAAYRADRERFARRFAAILREAAG